MTYEQFLKVILGLQKENLTVKKLYDEGIDLINFVDPYHTIISILMEAIYGKEGLEWFDWFCWENDFGNGGLSATDEKGNPICYSHESLWEFLEENHKK